MTSEKYEGQTLADILSIGRVYGTIKAIDKTDDGYVLYSQVFDSGWQRKVKVKFEDGCVTEVVEVERITSIEKDGLFKRLGKRFKTFFNSSKGFTKENSSG